MSVLMSVKRTDFYNELTEEKRKYYFNLNNKKVVHHIDTLYYSVFLENDIKGNVSGEIIEFVEILQEFKEKYIDKKEEMYFSNDVLFRGRRFSIYDYCLGKEGFWDIFIAKSLPNDDTPRIVVQLRSIGLWTIGEKDLILESYNFLLSILNSFGVKILKCMENRVDYAYHTNSIQSPYKFYNDKCLSENLKTSFKIYSKVGRKNDKKLTVEYLSLGNRKSNNLFFRSYNKVREVIEENYKEFFLEYWLNIGLINRYDFEVYSYAYKEKRYDSIYWGMLDFYLKNGTNENIKKYFLDKINNRKNVTIDEVKEILKGVLPQPTLVMNIEFQTMRKFYSSSDNLIDTLSFRNDITYDPLVRIFQIIDNRKIFLDYLTDYTVSFRKSDGSMMDFWSRVHQCKSESIGCFDLVREYKRNINKEMLIKKIKSNLATLSLYEGMEDTNIDKDFSLLLCLLNDNDVKEMKYDEYMIIKEKKKKALNSLLKKVNNPSPSHNEKS